MSTEMLMNELIERGARKEDIRVKLVEHHVKYREIDGIDETIWVTPKEHYEIHKKLRAQGRTVPYRIVQRAQSRACVNRMSYERITKRLKDRRDYYYSHTKQEHQTNKTYDAKYRTQFNFHETLVSEIIGNDRVQILLHERWYYNNKTGSFSITSSFRGMCFHNKLYKIPVIDI